MNQHQYNSTQDSHNTSAAPEILLKWNGWSKNGKAGTDLYFRGYLWFGNEQVLSSDSLRNLFEGHSPAGEDLTNWIRRSLLNKANGNFAIILKNDTGLFAATDIIRSHPLYLIRTAERCILSDSIPVEKQSLTPDTESMEQFLTTFSVFGHQTVYKEVTSVEPGETVWISNNGEVQKETYFRFIYNGAIENEISDEILHNRLDELLLSVFKRMIDSAPASTRWVIPLSGGIDSRLIANYLYRLGCKNVVCYSYGIPENEQSNLSREVANKLGFRWDFVEYTEQKWLALHQTGAIDSFIDYAFNGDSLPHLQDFLAVQELSARGIIDEKSIIVPGHQMGFITDFVEKDRPDDASTEALLGTLLNKNVKVGKPGRYSASLRKQFLQQIEEKKNIPHLSFSEYFSWANRHTKFTGHSVRAYEFYGIGWRLPYWEKELVEFWLDVDLSRRSNQRLYKQAAETTLFVKPLVGIPYAKKPHEAVERRISNKLKETLKHQLPHQVLVPLNRLFHPGKHANEGLSQIYALRAKDTEALIGKIKEWPKSLQPYLAPLRRRYTTQVNHHVLTALYTLYREVILKSGKSG
ncbi:asparagine synthase-related protein [Rhodohalobacter sp. 8-1]|uniref:asparagine synthase-related protein n=1 Tax=Rhodohalobacter sp. 8-1 TaxID=3131972 RepID=UPI0030EC7B88